MRKAVLLLTVCGATGVIFGGAAVAAPKPAPVCNLVTDAAGDASVDSAGAVADAALDVVSVDVASDRNNITAVIRVKKLEKSSARNWTAVFSADGTDFSLAGHTTAAGTEVFDAAYASATGGSIYGPGTTGVFDLAKNEVRITTPLSLLSEQATIKPGKTKVTGIGATTGAELLVPDASGVFGPTLFSYSPISADTTDAGKDYTAGAPSCVAVGK
jgi:hypothetical protein